jgi:hypothetical protein
MSLADQGARRIGTVLLILFAWAAWPAARVAAAEAIPTAVLGFEPLEGVPDTLAADVTDALRQRVAATKEYQLLQGKDLVEVKLVFACPDEAPACLSQAGKSLGASKLIFGNVKKTGADFQVTVKLLDVNRAVVESFTTDTVSGGKANATALRQLAPIWLAKLSGKGSGTISVRANFAGAAVSLDGTKVGVTGTAPVVISDVSPGKHEVAVEKSGYTTTKQEFTLASGQTLPLSLTLSPVSVEVARPEARKAGEGGGKEPPADDSEGPSLTRTGFWVALVGTLASAGLALKFGLNVRDINSKLDQYRRFDCPGAAAGSLGCDVHSMMAPPLTTEQLQQSHSLTDEGNKDQLLQWVFVGLTGAFAIAGGVLLYKGYLSSEGTQSASNHGLRLFPTATASSGGIIAEFEF